MNFSNRYGCPAKRIKVFESYSGTPMACDAKERSWKSFL
jgi:hypothetical protein